MHAREHAALFERALTFRSIVATHRRSTLEIHGAFPKLLPMRPKSREQTSVKVITRSLVLILERLKALSHSLAVAHVRLMVARMWCKAEVE